MNSLIVIFVSIFFTTFFSGMKICYISSNKFKLELDKKQSNSFSAFLLQRILHSPSNFILTMIVGKIISLVICVTFIANLLESKIEIYIQSPFLILLIQTLISFIIILFAAEFFPKIFFRFYANRLLKISVIPLTFFHFLLLPIVKVALLISKRGLKIIGITMLKDSMHLAKMNLKENLKLNFNQYINKNIDVEAQIFQNALDFSNITLRESMLPRTEIIAIEASKPIDELINIFIKTKLSKVLIFKENIDNIIGYTHSNEIFKTPKNIQSILIPISYVPENMMVNDLLTVFIKERKGIAVVVDEFGGTSGIITLEDVVEEIFGEIEDEHDNENDLEIKLNDTSFRFSARLEIDYLNNKYKFNLPKSDEYETLGGLLISKLEDIPKKNTKINIANHVIVVDEVSETKILSVSLIKTD